MPPFSRGASLIPFQLRTRNSSSFSKSPSQLPKPLSKPVSRPLIQKPSTNRHTKDQPAPSTQPKLPTETLLLGDNFIRFDPRYGFALVRLSIAQSSATLSRQFRKQYARLPEPVRYTFSFAYLLGIVFALIVPPAIVFRNHFCDIIRVTGPSMSPYLNTDFEDGATGIHDITKSTDRILLNLYRPRHDLRRGMVVAFRTPHDPEKWAIKRIVALQGDRVFPLAHYPEFEALNSKGLIVPFGHMWVEGDVSDSNKKHASMDSNIYGPVSTGLVMGRATHVITSFLRRWTKIDFKHSKLPERVQQNAVALQDPDEESQSLEFEEMFQNGSAAELLKALKRRLQEEGTVERCRRDPDLIDAFHIVRTQAKRQLSARDDQTSELATSLVAIVDNVLEEE